MKTVWILMFCLLSFWASSQELTNDMKRDKSTFEVGDLICSDNGKLAYSILSECETAYAENFVGVYTAKQTNIRAEMYQQEGIALVNLEENASVLQGDYITTSTGGYGMKATKTGFVIGQAIADPKEGQVRVLVKYEFRMAE